MPYVTLEQLTKRFGERLLLQLTDRATPPADEIDSEIVDQEIANTGAVIDGYLARRYALPLAEVPPMLGDLALAIAIYKLHPFAPDPKIERDYDQALKTLMQISKGDALLPLEGAEPASSGASGVEVVDRERPFTEDNLKGFI